MFSRSGALPRVCPQRLPYLSNKCPRLQILLHDDRKSMCIFFAGLKHTLIVGAYLSLITFPGGGVLSAPTNPKTMSSRMDSHPKWINPCGISSDNNGAVHESEVHNISDMELISQIFDLATIASSKAKHFKDEFVSTDI